ncbi:MAG: outer membrane homotrimeric porin, partial [Desulfohalobium sp.]
MKRMLIACLTGLVALALAVPASAVSLGSPDFKGEGIDFQVRGSFKAVGQWTDGATFDEETDDDEFVAGQRARTYFEMAANENVKYVLGLEIGETTWGNKEEGGALTADEKVVKVKHSYLDFAYGNLDVRAGLQAVSLPSHYGSNILNADGAALTVSTEVNDMLSVTAGWVRAEDKSGAGSQDEQGSNEYDIGFLAAPITMDTVDFTPFFAYAWLGKDTDAWAHLEDDANAYWTGFSGDVNLDPITVMADLNYGRVSAEEDENEQRGWYGYLEADYAMDTVTPALFGFYGSGDDDDADDGSEIMPKTGGEDYWMGGSTFLFDGGTLFAGIEHSDLLAKVDGLAGAGLKLKDIQFIDKLSHNFMFMWAQGTNDKKAVKDRIVTDDDVDGPEIG